MTFMLGLLVRTFMLSNNKRYFTVLSRPTLRLYFRQRVCVEAHLPVQVPIRSLCVLCRHTKAFIEAGKEVIEHAVSVVDGGCAP